MFLKLFRQQQFDIMICASGILEVNIEEEKIPKLKTFELEGKNYPQPTKAFEKISIVTE